MKGFVAGLQKKCGVYDEQAIGHSALPFTIGSRVEAFHVLEEIDLSQIFLPAVNEAKNPLPLPFNGGSFFSWRSFFPRRIEPCQSFMVVGRYPSSDGINGQLYLFGYFFRDNDAIIQYGDGLLPEAFIVGLSPVNKLQLVFLTHEANTPSIFWTTWVIYCGFPTPSNAGRLPRKNPRILEDVFASAGKNARYCRPNRGKGIYCNDGKSKRMQFAEIKNEFECISSLEVDQVHWDRAGNARLLRVNNVIIVIAKIHVAAMLDSEFIEVVLGPAQDL
jgi:hypothetical protein